METQKIPNSHLSFSVNCYHAYYQCFELFFKRVFIFPRGTCGKEPTCQCRRHKSLGLDPWVGKIPWRRPWLPTLVFLSGVSHGQRSLVGDSPCGRKESNTPRWLTATVLYFGFFGPEACEILAPQPGVETSLPALEGEVLTPGPPGSPLNSVFGQLFILFHELYIQGSSLVLSNEI